MIINQSIIETVKKAEITREVTFVLKDSKDKPGNKQLKKELCNQFESVNRNVTKKLDEIAKRTKLVPKRVCIKTTSPTWPLFDNDIEDVLDAISDISNLRVVVNFEDFNTNSLNQRFLDSSITHLIEVSLISHPNGDLNSLEGASTTVYVDAVHKVIRIIEDVMLDISMFYTFLETNDFADVLFRKHFSFSKVSLIERQKLNSNEWNPEINKGYVAIAGYFWSENGFDYIAYVDLWKKVTNDFINGDNKTKVLIDIETQLRRHKDYGELPVKRILKLMKPLSEGEYYLARIIKLPKRKKQKATLLNIFGGKVVRRGKIVIVTRENIHRFNKFLMNVNIFKLIK